WTRDYYRSEERTDLLDPPTLATHRLPLGQISPTGLPYERVRAAFSQATAAELFADRMRHVDLAKEGGYWREPDVPAIWWQPSGRSAYDSKQFHLPVASADGFGNRTQIRYDAYALLITERVDALRNISRTLNDYRLLEPVLLEDAN